MKKFKKGDMIRYRTEYGNTRFGIIQKIKKTDFYTIGCSSKHSAYYYKKYLSTTEIELTKNGVIKCTKNCLTKLIWIIKYHLEY